MTLGCGDVNDLPDVAAGVYGQNLSMIGFHDVQLSIGRNRAIGNAVWLEVSHVFILRRMGLEVCTDICDESPLTSGGVHLCDAVGAVRISVRTTSAGQHRIQDVIQKYDIGYAKEIADWCTSYYGWPPKGVPMLSLN